MRTLIFVTLKIVDSLLFVPMFEISRCTSVLPFKIKYSFNSKIVCLLIERCKCFLFRDRCHTYTKQQEMMQFVSVIHSITNLTISFMPCASGLHSLTTSTTMSIIQTFRFQLLFDLKVTFLTVSVSEIQSQFVCISLCVFFVFLGTLKLLAKTNKSVAKTVGA